MTFAIRHRGEERGVSPAGRRRVSGIAVAILAALLAIAVLVPSASGVHGEEESCPVTPRVSDHCADVAILITHSPTPEPEGGYPVGQAISVTVSATNEGPSPAPETTVAVDVPDGLTLNSAAPGTDDEFSNGVWQIDNIPGGGNNRTRTLTLTLTTNAPGSHTVTAELTGGGFEDFTPANNEDTLTINVAGGTTTTTSTPETTTTTSTPETTTVTTTTVPLTTTTSQGTTTGSTTTPATTTTTTTNPPTTPASQPIEGKKINAEETTGEIIVKLPGQKPRPINPEGELLPPGTKIDTTDGTVVLTSEYNGTFEQIEFWDGAFKLGQKESKDPVIVVKLINGFGSNGSEAGAAARSQAAKKRGKKSRRLWGKANKGHFRTQGRSGSATVRGTKWKTVDKVSGKTKFVLRRGKLFINDFSRGGNVDKVLKGKGKYVADPKAPDKKKAKKRRR